MSRYTNTQEIVFNNLRDSRAIVVVGSVVVSAWDELAYVEVETLTAGSYEYFTKGLKLKFTPAALASYWIDEGLLK
jgi:hypothetical protein